ncbi:hypothetical protein SAMN05443665_1015137 [Actinomadura meyerae]|uniref:Uncharacterized protein n=1 Tax=Actinomadura meyerae TaxID=240840 RepID=A0A239JRW6_9ACTN|nr:hypothetical protein [Actinomadura meyerae]SNT08272.1 hypothetical protein SAMN05443665_1015137 [Actinomadura meyerae]
MSDADGFTPIPGYGGMSPKDVVRVHAAERARVAQETADREAAETARDVAAAQMRADVQAARENLAQALMDAGKSPVEVARYMAETGL